MNAVISIILLAVALGAIVLLLTRRENMKLYIDSSSPVNL